jgi:hypothetical protein
MVLVGMGVDEGRRPSAFTGALVSSGVGVYVQVGGRPGTVFVAEGRTILVATAGDTGAGGKGFRAVLGFMMMSTTTPITHNTPNKTTPVRMSQTDVFIFRSLDKFVMSV